MAEMQNAQETDMPGVDVEKPRMKEPHWAMAFMSLLEDAGIVNIANRGSTFDEAMEKLAFPYLPDAVYHALALASGAYALMQLKVI